MRPVGLLIGLMMAFDMGGPVNKAAYAFSTGLLLAAHPVILPMAAAMAAGMTPPLGLVLATVLFKNRFTHDEKEAGKGLRGCWARPSSLKAPFPSPQKTPSALSPLS